MTAQSPSRIHSATDAEQAPALPVGAAPGKRFARKWPHEAHIDAIIVHGYRTAKRRGDLKAIAERAGRPKLYVSRRAVELGLTNERMKPLPWSAAELAILEAAASCTLPAIRRNLKAAGYVRTATAIAVMRKRRGLDTSDPDTWSARDLGRLLGVDGGTVSGWIDRRGLKAERNTPGDKASPWRIKRRDLLVWLKANHGRIDLRRVDQTWFMDLVLGAGA